MWFRTNSETSKWVFKTSKEYGIIADFLNSNHSRKFGNIRKKWINTGNMVFSNYEKVIGTYNARSKNN